MQLPTFTLLAAGVGLLLPAGVQEPSAALATTPDGLAWSDVDVDGLPDLLARGDGDGVVLLRNTGDGDFVDVTASYCLDGLRGVRRASWNDVDGDGLEDLLVVGVEGSPRLLRNLGPSFLDVTAEAGLEAESSVAALAEHWLDYDRDGRDDLLLVGVEGQVLFHNLGGLRFQAEALPAALSTPRAPATRATHAGATAAGEDAIARGGGDATDDEAAARDGRRPLGRRSAAVTATGGTVNAGGPGSPGWTSTRGADALGAPAECLPALADQAGGACIEASSIPTFGDLYPMTVNLNVSAATGDVGVGTTQPLAKLHVMRLDQALHAGALYGSDFVIEDGDAVMGLYSSSGGGWGSTLSLAQLDEAGGLADAWSLSRETTGNGDGDLHLKFGSNTNYSLNQDVMVFEPDGNVRLGSPTTARLTVNTFSPTGAVAQIEQYDSASTSDALVVYHNGLGAAINASTITGPYAIRATGGPKGIYAAGTSNGVHAYTNSGTALRAENGPGSATSAALIQSQANFPTLYVTNLDATNPQAASFGGDVSIGYPGGLGLTVPRAVIGADSTNAGFVQLMDDTGATTILLDGNSGGEGRITTDVLEITGGADLVEGFDTREDAIEPGTVLVIDAEHAGELAVSRDAYDRKVAGVVSGAGGVKHGLMMGQAGVASGDTPVALTGRVFVKASAENGPIRPGDRLTTAATHGHAMRVADADAHRAGGAVIGKAMGALDSGTGLVLVLVNLQ